MAKETNRNQGEEGRTLITIARIRTDFPTKFGIPRQSGLVTLQGVILFQPEYRNPDALRGIEAYSHLWLIWGFSQAKGRPWSPTVRPPRLGGNKRLGVFATRSPFRPNSLGLSSVKLEGIELDADLGPILHVSGVDLLDNTPIYDIKPYLPYTDSHPEAVAALLPAEDNKLKVVFPQQFLNMLPEEKREAVQAVLALDPRPSYQKDPTRIYGMEFGGFEIRFTVEDDQLSVRQVMPL